MRLPSFFSRFLSLTLVGLVLAASVGLPVQRRTCRLSGRSTARIAWDAVATGAFANGTTEDFGIQDSTAALGAAAACYAYSLQLHQLSPETRALESVKQLTAPVSWLGPSASAGFRRLASFWLPAPAGVASRVAGPLPRPGGRALLVRISTLIV